MRIAGLAALLAFALALPAQATSTGLRGTGLRGTGLRGLVMRGPVTPVCAAEQPCDAPARHVTLTFSRNGSVFSVTTGEDGRYRILLAAGAYRVRLAPAHGGYSPTTAVVSAGRVAVRNFFIDTGIR